MKLFARKVAWDTVFKKRLKSWISKEQHLEPKKRNQIVDLLAFLPTLTFLLVLAGRILLKDLLFFCTKPLG